MSALIESVAANIGKTFAEYRLKYPDQYDNDHVRMADQTAEKVSQLLSDYADAKTIGAIFIYLANEGGLAVSRGVPIWLYLDSLAEVGLTLYQGA